MKIDTIGHDRTAQRTTCYRVETTPAWEGMTWLASAQPVTSHRQTGERGCVSLRRRRDRQAARVAAAAAYEAATAVSARGAVPCRAAPSVSLAHSEGHGVAALQADSSWQTGIDLERRGAVAPRYARYFTTSRERESCPFSDPTVLWTLKEAAWKALRCEPSLPFHELETLWTTRQHPRGLRLAGLEIPARFLVLVPWPGWILSAVSVETAA